ncbi:hypothetical protein [Dyadobacter sp. CY323]|uniref:hypothetical protein n=1 Tax=Dyadobacter sp. CY323 TaxID=2907302 RepID=UPI001F2681F7|nr:hypothetical protein [Dyadobacter sp. CY323]MCE6991099.1 hypothetical protein [Dyadobacter sp. CY323]
MIELGRLILSGMLFTGFTITAAWLDTGPIRYFNIPTVSLPGEKTVSHILKFDDDDVADTLFEVRSAEGYPVSYFRNIRTSVCFDNKCRLLAIRLYWNITGRYLGYEVPKGEYLSKAEHEPFKAEEYARLHQILSDENSPLRSFTYEDLAPGGNQEKAGVDGVSSATSKDVLSYVVEGAVYTTYKMWHILYGTTQTEVIRLTKTHLNEDLVLKILNSPDRSDKVWALDQVNGRFENASRIPKKIIELVDSRDFHLSEQALNSVHPNAFTSDSLQLLLLAKFKTGNYNLKNSIVTKCRQVSKLNAAFKTALTNELQTSQGTLFVNTLELFKNPGNNNAETTRVIANLMGSENRFIARKSFDFLKKLENKNPRVEELVRQYEAKNGLDN